MATMLCAGLIGREWEGCVVTVLRIGLVTCRQRVGGVCVSDWRPCFMRVGGMCVSDQRPCMLHESGRGVCLTGDHASCRSTRQGVGGVCISDRRPCFVRAENGRGVCLWLATMLRAGLVGREWERCVSLTGFVQV